MKHSNLRPTLTDGIGQVHAAVTRKASTRPHGVKVMQPGEDTYWEDEAGTTKSVRAMDLLVGGLEEGLSTASRFNTVSTSPAPASADGYPAGGFWTQVDDELVEVDRWIVKDDAWVRVGLDAGRLVAGSLDVGLIDAIAMAAKLITSGAFRTSATGQRVEITSDGLTLWMTGPDGTEYEAVQIGPDGANLITVGTSRIAPDSVTSTSGAFTNLSIAGQPAAGYVDGRIWSTAPRMVAIGGAGASSGNIGMAAGVETGLFDVLVPNVQPSHWYRAEVELITYPLSNAAELQMGLRHSPVAQGVMTNSPAVAGKRIGPFSGTAWDHRHVTFWFPGSKFTLVGTGGTARLLLTVTASKLIEAHPDTTMVVYTEGQPMPFSSTLNRGGASVPGSSVVPPAPPSVSVQTQTIEWWAGGSSSYYTSSGASYTGSPDAIQGSYSGSGGDNRYTCWWFADLTGRLAGATINNVEMYVANNWTYANAGGTGHFWSHNGGTGAGANIMNAWFNRGEARWLQIPAQYWDALKNGSMRGFMSHTPSNARNEYLRFNGGGMSACLRITYTK